MAEKDKYRFSNGQTAINVKTVADAIKELSLLPPDLSLDQSYDGHGADIVVMNIGQESGPFVEFAEGGFWDMDAKFADDDEEMEEDT